MELFQVYVTRLLPVFSIQYHSEASPGPKDSEYIFDQFIEKIISRKKKNEK